MGRDGSRRRDKTKHQQAAQHRHQQESAYEHAVEEQRRERDDVLENFGVSGRTGRMIVGAASVVLFACAIFALLYLIALR
ncbi:MAG: hypothetical protein ACOYNI_09610 [Acidimicrobiia bacterium]